MPRCQPVAKARSTIPTAHPSRHDARRRERPARDNGGMTDDTGRLRYRLLTGPDDSTFCERVSEALNSGYELYGSPAATFDGERVIVAQAIVLPAASD